MPGHAVRAERAHHRGDTGGGQVAQHDLRRPGGEAAFAAAADQMDMLVDESGDHETARDIDHLGRTVGGGRIDPVGQMGDTAIRQQHVLDA